MSSAEPGSGSLLGLVLLTHTARCIVTILFHCVKILRASLDLIPLWLRTLVLAAKLAFNSTIQSAGIVLTSSITTFDLWLNTLGIIFWTLSFTTFLVLIIPCAVVIILLEKCETAYLRLPSFPFEAAAREFLDLTPLDQPSLDPSDPSVILADPISSAPKKTPSSRASTPRKHAHRTFSRPSHVQRFIRNITVYLLMLIKKAATLVFPKEAEPSCETTRSSHDAQKPVHLKIRNQSYRVTRAANFISIVKDALLSKIVEHWEKFPTPTPSSRALHLQMRPFLTRETQTETKVAKPSQDLPQECRHQSTGFVVSPPASLEEALCPVTQRSPARTPSPPPKLQRPRKIRTKEFTHPITGETWETVLYAPPGVASRTLTVLSSLTASLSKSSLTSFTGSERKVSQQTVPSRKTSISSTFGSNAPTRTATPTPATTNDNPLIITTAQPSAYWSGRFLSLQDRFQGECLQEKTLATLITAHATKATLLAQQREAYKDRGNLPLSTTTALDHYGTAANRGASLLSDEDNRCLRIFLHLDALCDTPEAQKSLHAWQEAYARKNRREALLPKSTGVERGFVARLFSGSSRQGMGGSRSDKETTKGKQVLSAF
ncbi:hypothetical protein LX32DRAFT_709410 [Colletotrichum zoysiae]|uniref:Uncharacterized protein n=1 Tax=Colletotrichum zoysiae TaxID=1216348 RepID=A0AAD9H6P9_9PEZI|nr:hypothetical protein LX32DRAFT_709410 [Colletotrichum zoysiae]